MILTHLTLDEIIQCFRSMSISELKERYLAFESYVEHGIKGRRAFYRAVSKEIGRELHRRRQRYEL